MSINVNPGSADWLNLRHAIDARVAEILRELTDPRSETETARLRGAVHALWELVRDVEGTDPPLPEVTPDYL